MTAATAPHLHGESDLKSIIMLEAEQHFADAAVPFRPGRMARLVRSEIRSGGGTEQIRRLVLLELDMELRKIQNPRIRDARGVIDPTGQLAVARAEAARRVREQKNAPAAGCHRREGEVTTAEGAKK